MTRLRYHILAGTALAVILAAVPLGGLALDGSNKMPPAPAAASPAQQIASEASAPNSAVTETAATTEPANTEPAATTELTVTAEQAAPPPDPMASLDPADRPVAEKIRDFFAGTSDRIFANM